MNYFEDLNTINSFLNKIVLINKKLSFVKNLSKLSTFFVNKQPIFRTKVNEDFIIDGICYINNENFENKESENKEEKKEDEEEVNELQNIFFLFIHII